MNPVKRIFLIMLTSFLFIIGLFIMAIGGLLTYSTLFTKGYCNKTKEPIIITHKGWTVKAQENTLEAINDSYENKRPAGFDIVILKTGEIILYSDDNFLDKTGTNLDISEANIDQVKEIKYLNTINNYEYKDRLSIPLFYDIIESICRKNPSATLNFVLKFHLTEENLELLFRYMDTSRCNCNDSQMIIYETANYDQINFFKYVMDNKRCKGLISLYIHPGTYPLGEYFWLKTLFPLLISNPDIVNIYYKIWDTHPEFLNLIRDRGFCTAVYGNIDSELIKYNVTAFRKIDLSNSTINNSEYTPNYSVFSWMFGVLIASVFSFSVSIILIIYLQKNK